jgi:iron complex outermembrane recepter protein
MSMYKISSSRLSAKHLTKTFLLAGSACLLAAGPLYAAESQEVASNHSSSQQDNVGDLVAGDAIVVAQADTKASANEHKDTSKDKSSTSANRSSDPTGNASSMMVAQGANPTADSLHIRGVGAVVTSMGVESDVSAAVDGVVVMRGIERTMTSYADYADLDHGEVLYGPQGTLFSKNAIGGAVNIVTRAPTDYLSGNFTFGMGEAGEYHEKATISDALSDSVSVRLSFFNNNVPGYIHNVVTHKDGNYKNSWGFSGKTLWNVDANLDLIFSASYSNEHGDCCKKTYIRVDSPVLAALLGSVVASKKNEYDTRNAENDYKNQKMMYSLTANYNLGFATLTSITAFQSAQWDTMSDNDGIDTPYPIYTGGSGGNYYAKYDDNPTNYRMQQFSQDFKISSNNAADSRLNYLGGVYLYHYNLSMYSRNRLAYCSQGTLGEECADEYVTWKSRETQAAESIYHAAVYGEFTYRLIDSLTGFGGARLQYEKIQMAGVCNTPATDYSTDTAYSGTCGSGVGRASDIALTGDAGLRYGFDWGSAYIRLAHGYKGKGFNMGSNVDYGTQSAVDPETNNSLEIGLSASTPDKHFTFDGTIYQTNYTNMQVSVTRQNTETGTNDSLIMAAGTARSRGFEVGMTQRLFPGLSLRESVIFTEAVFNLSGNSCPITAQSSTQSYASMSAAPDNTCYTVSGNSTKYMNTYKGLMPYSPKWKIQFAPRYGFGIPETDYNGFVQAVVNYTTRQTFDLAQDPGLYQKAYTIVNATVGASDKDQKYQLSLSVNNIFNQLYYASTNRIQETLTTTSYNNIAAIIPRDATRHFSLNLSVKY